MEKLIPYCLYLPEEHIKKLKKLAKSRKASEFVRNAVVMALAKTDEFSSVYNKGITDSFSIINDNKEAKMIAVKSRYLCDILSDQIRKLRHEAK
jgi:homoserine dehydrogenase